MTRVRKPSKPYVKQKPSAKRSMGSVRIISGQHRGRKLPVLDAEGLRPTADRMKETLFNWLMADVNAARCLDMFAGSGALGFEALSRHAQHCTFIEMQFQAANQLKANVELLKLDNSQSQVIQGDALKSLDKIDKGEENKGFDIVFIDPPFGQQLVQAAIDALSQTDLLKSGSKIYIEHETDVPEIKYPSNWTRLKQQAGRQSCANLFELS